jgi:hypothetical protein
MANFIDHDERGGQITFGDGFRFGFGFFIANLLGLMVIGGLVLLGLYLTNQLHT